MHVLSLDNCHIGRLFLILDNLRLAVKRFALYPTSVNTNNNCSPEANNPRYFFFAFAVKQITFILIQIAKGTIDKPNFVIALFQIHVSLKAVVLHTISAAK